MNISELQRDSENFRIVQKLIDREVHLCVSGLVQHFAASECPEAYDITDILIKDDYESAVRDSDSFNYVVDTKDEGFWINFSPDLDNTDNPDNSFDVETWEEAAEALGIEPYESEALEHWAVSTWIGEKLEKRDEMIGELFDITIWGRTCSGQAIALDSVWWEIAYEMEILKGQKRAWMI